MPVIRRRPAGAGNARFHVPQQRFDQLPICPASMPLASIERQWSIFLWTAGLAELIARFSDGSVSRPKACLSRRASVRNSAARFIRCTAPCSPNSYKIRSLMSARFFGAPEKVTGRSEWPGASSCARRAVGTRIYAEEPRRHSPEPWRAITIRSPINWRHRR
jgi:hypothetical protein